MEQRFLMLLRISSHLHADTIAEGDFHEQWGSLVQVLGTLEPPLRVPQPFTTSGRPPTPKRQIRSIGGRRKWAMFPVDQATMNLRLDSILRGVGWASQPVVAAGLVAGPVPTGLLGDFAKDGVFVEVEFGNMASVFRDLFKFQIAARSGAGQVGVLIVAVDKVARFFDQGVATYEQATKLLPYMNIGIQLPTVIVGLDLNVEGWQRVRRRYGEMQTVCEANGLECHSFDAVFGAPDQGALDLAD